MTKPRTSFRTHARLSLLLAATLHFASLAMGWAHAGGVREEPTASAEQPQDRRRPHAPAPHDERSCTICHAFTAAALPTAPPPASVATARAAATPMEAREVRASIRTSSCHARAPPLA
jgi:hypothetical protein